jgi:hypothetical protein
MNKIGLIALAGFGFLVSVSSFAADYDQHSACYKKVNEARNACRNKCYKAYKKQKDSRDYSILNPCQNKCDKPFNDAVKACPHRKHHKNRY